MEPISAEQPPAQTKACPFCAETIQERAIRCRFCNSDLVPSRTQPPAPAQEPPAPSAAPGTPETVLWSHPDGIRITTSRAIFPSRTYYMANITSVAYRELPADRRVGFLVALVGAMAFIPSINLPLSNLVIGGSLALVAIGAVLAVLPKPKYSVRLDSAAGAEDAWTWHEPVEVRRAVHALNEAFIQRH